jgi:hypothetical protein
MAAAGAAAIVGAVVGGTRGAAAVEARMVFTQVRLLPCLVRDTLERGIAPVAGAIRGQGVPPLPQLTTTAAAAAPITLAQGGVAGAAAINPGLDGGAAKVASEIAEEATRAFSPFREGFERAIDANREVGDVVGDSRLMIQLGMALGWVYVAFLSVWFWATRLRRGDDA